MSAANAREDPGARTDVRSADEYLPADPRGRAAASTRVGGGLSGAEVSARAFALALVRESFAL